MDLEEIKRKRSRLEKEAQEKIQEALNGMRSDLQASNEEVNRQLKEEIGKKTIGSVEDKNDCDNGSSIGDVQPRQPSVQQQEVVKKPLVFFSYPMTGYDTPPVWTQKLRHTLVSNGYLVYNPWDTVDEQYSQSDLPLLNALPVKLVKSLCSVLCIPDECLLPFEAVWKILQQASQKDNYSIVFQSLWFLVRSSLVVCDLIRPVAGGCGMPHELLWSQQLGLPVIGLFPSSGYLSPFAHRSVTCLFSGTDLIQLLPIIKGYTPIL